MRLYIYMLNSIHLYTNTTSVKTTSKSPNASHTGFIHYGKWSFIVFNALMDNATLDNENWSTEFCLEKITFCRWHSGKRTGCWNVSAFEIDVKKGSRSRLKKLPPTSFDVGKQRKNQEYRFDLLYIFYVLKWHRNSWCFALPTTILIQIYVN